MLFQLSEIKLKHPDLHAFLCSDSTENLFSMAEHLNAVYEIELIDKKLVSLPILEIIAITSTPAHFKTLIEIKHTKSPNQNITDKELINSFRAAVRCNQVMMASYLLETYSSVLNHSKILNLAKEKAITFKLEEMKQFLETKTKIKDNLRSGEKSELPIKKSSTIDQQLAQLSFFNIGQYKNLDVFEPKEITLSRKFKEHGIILPGSIENVPDDGNCFFHAFSRELKRLTNQDISHIDLRLAGISYINDNKDQFEHFFCTEGSSCNETESLDDYLVRMTYSGDGDRPGAWADSPIITATARKFNIQLDIQYMYESEENDPQQPNEDETGELQSNEDEKSELQSKVTISLVLYQNHYYILNLDKPTYTEQVVDIKNLR